MSVAFQLSANSYLILLKRDFVVLLSSPQVGLLRFLHLLSSFDWKNNPLVVNLNNKLTGQYDSNVDV